MTTGHPNFRPRARPPGRGRRPASGRPRPGRGSPRPLSQVASVPAGVAETSRPIGQALWASKTRQYPTGTEARSDRIHPLGGVAEAVYAPDAEAVDHAQEEV